MVDEARRLHLAESIIRKLLYATGSTGQTLCIDSDGGVVLDAYVYLDADEQAYLRNFE